MMHKNNETMVEFIHIPKCGGWTIHQYFIDLIGLNRTLDLTYCEQITEPQLDDIGMILGHRDVRFFDALREYHGYRSFRFTTVREPVERLWSYYRYLSMNKRLETIDWVPESTFSEFCERVVAKTVSGYNHEISQANYITGKEHPDESEIDQAINHNFDAICTVNKIHNILTQISTKLKLGLSLVQWLNKEEPGRYTASDHVTREEIQFINKNFEEDYYLYNKVMENETFLG